MTHRALDLGFTGLALFLPGLLFLLPAGHVADRFDRRHVILVCYALQVLCTTALLMFALQKIDSVLPIYTVLFFIGTGRAFSGPASSALVPHLVPEEHFVNAVTWGGAIFQVANFTGPALGGLMYTLPLTHWWPGTHLEGAGIVYAFMLAMLVWFLALMSSLKVRLGRMEHKAASMEVVLAGFKYVWSRSLLLGAISLDLFAVLLGGAVALMPIFASDILHTGPRGLGLLRAAPAVGALMTSLVMARFPISRRAGKRMFVAVAIFGVATLIFGLSRSLWISLGALAISGAADMISVIIRGSLMQLATPAEMRGRVSAVNSLFIGASNELGEFESGLTAQWWGAVRATVVGGVASVAVAAAWAGLFPELRRADRMTSEELRGRQAGAPAGS
jgi:Transmembrane secretion effector